MPPKNFLLPALEVLEQRIAPAIVNPVNLGVVYDPTNDEVADIYGPSHSHSGFAVSNLGDFNGDGYGDFISSGSPVANGLSKSFVLLGHEGLDVENIGFSFQMTGTVFGDLFGFSVSGAGDFNNDGYDDIIIGAPDINSYALAGAGAAYVIFGRSLVTGDIDLSSLDGTNGFRIDGKFTGDWAGYSVSGAGDVNGDGNDDLLIGAPSAGSAGEAYVVFGTSTAMTSVMNLSSLNGINGFQLGGVNVDERTGNVVSEAGDVNADGFDDLLIAAPFASPNGQYSGSTYVVFGNASGIGLTINLSSLDGTNGFRLDGFEANHYLGTDLSGLKDVSGDGVDDFIIGTATNPGLNSSSYVIFGSTSGFSSVTDLSSLDGSQGFSIAGLHAGDHAGESVSSAGDINGDGFQDIVIGARGATPEGLSYAGSAYVVFGKAGGISNIDLAGLDGSKGVRIDGFRVNMEVGTEVSGAGDINGDGFDDLILGAPSGAFLGGGGVTFLILGKADWYNHVVTRPADLNFEGAAAGSQAGQSVAGIGDFNHDGYGDIAVGSPGAGASYVVFGNSAGIPSVDFSNLDGNNGFTIFAGGDWLGYSVAGAGDVNGDGIDDLIIGAPLAGASSPGAAYIVFGKSQGIDPVLNVFTLDGTNGFRVEGISGNNEIGSSVSGAGDVNNDGFADIIIGARRTNSAYVIFGGGDGFDAAINVSTLDGTNGFSLSGQGYFGASVAGAGDINGDGFADLIVGAPHANPNLAYHAGSAYVVFGKSVFSNTLDVSSLDGNNGFRLDGEFAEKIGLSVAGAGDVNGDGFDDILVGAPKLALHGIENVGAAYLVFGKASGFSAAIHLSALDGEMGLRFNGTGPNDFSGSSVAGAGDVNQDGFADIIIGNSFADFLGTPGAGPNGDFNGSAYVVYGKPQGFGAVFDLSLLDGTNGFGFATPITESSAGRSVASAGDFNGDGIDDLIIGAPLADPNGNTDGGSAYVVYGSLQEATDFGLSITPNGRKATFIDAEGDLITIAITKGDLHNALMTFAKTGKGVTLETLDLNGDIHFEKTNLTIKANAVGFDGDGLASVGYINATGIDLGKVRVDGDLGRIASGDAVLTTDGLKGLKVTTFGTKLSVASERTSHIEGAISSLIVTDMMQGVEFTAGMIGAITVTQLTAGEWHGTQIHSDTIIKSVKVKGEIAGSASNLVQIFAEGRINPANAKLALAIGKISVEGNVSHAQILAGYGLAGSATNSQVRIGKVSVDGGWRESSLIAGIDSASLGQFGDANDVVTSGGGMIASRVAEIVIKGEIFGSSDSNQSFGIEAQGIGKVSIARTRIEIPENSHSVQVGTPDNTTLREFV